MTDSPKKRRGRPSTASGNTQIPDDAKRLSVDLDKDLLEAIHKAGKKYDMSAGAVVRQCVAAQLIRYRQLDLDLRIIDRRARDCEQAATKIWTELVAIFLRPQKHFRTHLEDLKGARTLLRDKIASLYRESKNFRRHHSEAL